LKKSINSSFEICQKTKCPKFNWYIREFGDELFIQTDILYCKSCETKLRAQSKSHVRQHLETPKHQKSMQTFNCGQITTRQTSINNRNDFNSDLCQFLISTNIPFYRLLMPEFKAFIEKYTHFKVPNPPTLWRYNLKNFYNNVNSYIHEKLSKEYIWIYVETTDCMDRYVVSVIVSPWIWIKTKILSSFWIWNL
jgi:hypothetical protein